MKSMSDIVLQNYLSDTLSSFRSYKKLAERAVSQVSDEEFFETIDSESNSIALIVKHMAGNLNSRWTDFLTTDGEKDFRDRDSEFELIADTRESLMEFWESGWNALFRSIEPLLPHDLSRNITIRGQPHTVVEAINRQMTHYAYHVGQIVFLAKHIRSGEWTTLSVPRKQSSQFNQFLAQRQNTGSDPLNRHDAAEVFNKEKSEP